jgi:hypothetical protein
VAKRSDVQRPLALVYLGLARSSDRVARLRHEGVTEAEMAHVPGPSGCLRRGICA